MKKILALTFLAISLQAFSQDELPNVNVTTLDGTTISLQKASKSDSPVVISLWATWCVPCLKELDAISEVYDDWKDETNVSLIAVSVDDSRTVKRVKPLINGSTAFTCLALLIDLAKAFVYLDASLSYKLSSIASSVIANAKATVS